MANKKTVSNGRDMYVDFAISQGMYYYMRHRKAVKVVDAKGFRAYERQFKARRRKGGRKVRTNWMGDTLISTVFLGIEHSLGCGGEPTVFETMTFDKNGKQALNGRCSTWREALRMHRQAVEIAKEASR